MRLTKLLPVLFGFCLLHSSFGICFAGNVRVDDTTGQLLYPTNFWDNAANAAGVTRAAGGGGSNTTVTLNGVVGGAGTNNQFTATGTNVINGLATAILLGATGPSNGISATTATNIFNGLIGSATGALASVTYVQGAVQAATNGVANTNYAHAVTNGLATIAYTTNLVNVTSNALRAAMATGTNGISAITATNIFNSLIAGSGGGSNYIGNLNSYGTNLNLAGVTSLNESNLFIYQVPGSSGLLIPQMTASNAPSGLATASSDYRGGDPNQGAYGAFTNGEWVSGVEAAPWLQYHFNTPVAVSAFTMGLSGASTNQFQSSADGTNWTTLLYTNANPNGEWVSTFPPATAAYFRWTFYNGASCQVTVSFVNLSGSASNALNIISSLPALEIDSPNGVRVSGAVDSAVGFTVNGVTIVGTNGINGLDGASGTNGISPSGGISSFNVLSVTNCVGLATNFNGIYTYSGFGYYTNNSSGWYLVSPGILYGSNITPYRYYTLNTNLAQIHPSFGYSGATLLGYYTGRYGAAATNQPLVSIITTTITSLPATAITGAPWLTNAQSGVTLAGTFTGNGGGLTNLAGASSPTNFPASAITNAPWLTGASNVALSQLPANTAGLDQTNLNNAQFFLQQSLNVNNGTNFGWGNWPRTMAKLKNGGVVRALWKGTGLVEFYGQSYFYLLSRSYPIAGFFAPYASANYLSGTYAYTVAQGSTNNLQPYYVMIGATNGMVQNVIPYQVPLSSVYAAPVCDTYTWSFLTGPTAGTVQIWTNNGYGGAFAYQGTSINCQSNVVTALIVQQSLSHCTPTVLITNISGTNALLSYGAWDSTISNGFMIGLDYSLGGIGDDKQTNHDATFLPISKNQWQPDLVFYETLMDGTANSQGQYDAIMLRFLTNCGSDFVSIGNYPNSSDSNMVAQAVWTLALTQQRAAQGYNVSMVDLHSPFISYDVVMNRLLTPDGVHLYGTSSPPSYYNPGGAIGYDFCAACIWNWMDFPASKLYTGTLSLAQLPGAVVTNHAAGIVDFPGGITVSTNAAINNAGQGVFTSVQSSNCNFSGTVNATAFTGNGSGLTNLNAASLTSGTNTATIQVATLKTAGNVQLNNNVASAYEVDIGLIGSRSGFIDLSGLHDGSGGGGFLTMQPFAIGPVTIYTNLVVNRAVFVPTNIPAIILPAGYCGFWPSNCDLYWVTPLKTNLITLGH